MTLKISKAIRGTAEMMERMEALCEAEPGLHLLRTDRAEPELRWGGGPMKHEIGAIAWIGFCRDTLHLRIQTYANVSKGTVRSEAVIEGTTGDFLFEIDGNLRDEDHACRLARAIRDGVAAGQDNQALIEILRRETGQESQAA